MVFVIVLFFFAQVFVVFGGGRATLEARRQGLKEDNIQIPKPHRNRSRYATTIWRTNSKLLPRTRDNIDITTHTPKRTDPPFLPFYHDHHQNGHPQAFGSEEVEQRIVRSNAKRHGHSGPTGITS